MLPLIIVAQYYDIQYNRYCYICGRDLYKYGSPERDHYIPKSFGGSNGLSNLRPTCTECNRRKSNLIPSLELFVMLYVASKLPYNIPQSNFGVLTHERVDCIGIAIYDDSVGWMKLLLPCVNSGIQSNQVDKCIWFLCNNGKLSDLSGTKAKAIVDAFHSADNHMEYFKSLATGEWPLSYWYKQKEEVVHMSDTQQGSLVCAFCGKPYRRIYGLIGEEDPKVYICNSCAEYIVLSNCVPVSVKDYLVTKYELDKALSNINSLNGEVEYHKTKYSELSSKYEGLKSVILNAVSEKQ